MVGLLWGELWDVREWIWRRGMEQQDRWSRIQCLMGSLKNITSLPVLCLCVGMKAWMKYITKVLETSTPYRKFQGCTDLEVVVWMVQITESGTDWGAENIFSPFWVSSAGRDWGRDEDKGEIHHQISKDCSTLKYPNWTVLWAVGSWIMNCFIHCLQVGQQGYLWLHPSRKYHVWTHLNLPTVEFPVYITWFVSSDILGSWSRPSSMSLYCSLVPAWGVSLRATYEGPFSVGALGFLLHWC